MASDQLQRIGVNLEDLRMPIKDGLRAAAKMEFGGVELPSAGGEASARNLDASGRRHLSHLVRGLGLSISALTAEFPGLRLTDAKTVHERVERSIEIIQLAADLKVLVVTAAVGQLTHPESAEPSPMAAEALGRIGEFADTRGVFFAIRPTCDSGERVVRVLDQLRCPSLSIGFDPAALVMSGVNPLADIEKFVRQIGHFHARDATAGFADRPGHETRLGEGEVDLVGCLMVLQAIEYRGAYVIRRTESAKPMEEMMAAKAVLTRAMEHAAK